MAKITQLRAREILDSRGFPTIETEVHCDNGIIGRGAVPSGASTGSLEAIELRDSDHTRYLGKGVIRAIENVNNNIADKIKGMDVCDISGIDQSMIDLDSTKNKSKLGANAILSTSLACARAAASSKGIPLYEFLNHMFLETLPSLPVPLMNILNGGAHADNNVDIQEFMVVPIGAPNFAESLRWGTEIYHALKSSLKSKNLSTSVGDEGGFAPNLPNNETALDLLLEAIEKTGLNPGKDVYLALDVAATEIYKNGKYVLSSTNSSLDSKEFAATLANWSKSYPIISIEDGMDESDWSGWHYLNSLIGDKVQLVGDDIFVTNVKLLQKGIEKKSANSILIKLNQIGTLTETVQTIELARESNFSAIISHRSGETEDSFIADLSVAAGMGQIKTGAPCRSDRNSKYNQLLRISELVGTFSGARAYSRWLI
jgi:enolase